MGDGRRLLSWFVGGLLAVITFGCSNRTLSTCSDCMRPVASRVVYFATNIKSNTTPSHTFVGHRNFEQLSFGRITVEFDDHLHSFGEIESGVRVARIELLPDADAFKKEIAKHSNFIGSINTVIYVHGYNENLVKATLRLAQIGHDAQLDAVPILFAWPSRGDLLAYAADADAARSSTGSFSKFLQIILPGRAPKTHIIAHSLGSEVVLGAARRQDWNRQGRNNLAGSIIFASPDVDLAAFRQALPATLASARRVALLTSTNDALLSISTFLTGGNLRAGNASLEQLAHVGIESGENLLVMDMDRLRSTPCRGGSHRCATTNPEILAMIKTLLEEGPGHRRKLTPPAFIVNLTPVSVH